ncbi:glycogen debranching N-terminal domain-containing protein [Streptomyces tritici]|uniref:glycogen debranching N-terminal domain-containing protein n=1 Tax=Streptomyces tritici TaxID=2054410 RepID=UPI003AEF8406
MDPRVPAPAAVQAAHPAAGRPTAPHPAAGPAPQRGAPPGEPPAVHALLVAVALPWLVLCGEHGRLTGEGLDGIYHAGRRLLSRSVLRVYGREPIAVQGRLAAADRIRFVGVLRTPGDVGPDPGLTVERVRRADGTERITLRSSAARPLRLPVELALGTDLADLGAVAAGRPGPELSAGVHAAGLRWAAPDGRWASVTAEPPPTDSLAVAGLLRWDLDLAPGGTRTIELRVRGDRPAERRSEPVAGDVAGPGGQVLAEARAEGDDPRVGALLGASLGDLRGLLLRDRARPDEVHAAAGVPWRCGPVTAESLWAARMALPLGVRLATGTLRALARGQRAGGGPDRGWIPGPLRDSGPGLPPRCTGTEATLAFPAVLAEAARWGLPEQELAELLPAAERCLDWLRAASDPDGFVPDPGPAGPRRAETQAHAHRAAELGADLLELCGRPGAAEWRDRAAALRQRFRREFWREDLGGGRPVAALLPDGTPLPLLGSWAAHLLDTGLTGGGRTAPGLLDKRQTDQLARLLGGPALDTGWGLRGLGAKEPGHNPFGHRSGAVRAHETAVAVAGLAGAGHEREAAALLRGLLDAAEAFGYRLPEMYAGEQRTAGAVPVPHPAACRPAAVAAAGAVHALVALAGIRPDAPGRTVALRPMRSAPLGAVLLAGLRVAGEPFAVRIGRLGTAIVEQAAEGLQLGV